MTFEQAQKIFLLFLSIYLFVGVAAHVMSDSTEDLYPFFSWFLFVNVPSRMQTDFDIQIITADGHALNPPATLEEFLKDDVSERELRGLIAEFGRAAENKENASVLSLRRELEQHLREPITYELQKVQFNPLTRFRTGEVISRRVIGRFVTSSLP